MFKQVLAYIVESEGVDNTGKLKETLYDKAGSLISNLKYNQKDLPIIAGSIVKKYFSINSSPIQQLRDILTDLKNFNSNEKNIKLKTGVPLLCAYLVGLVKGYNPSGAGFLFESFIAGMIGGSTHGTENKFTDVIAGTTKLSIKFLGRGSRISNAFNQNDFDEDTYYIVAIKDGATSVTFYVINVEKAKTMKGVTIEDNANGAKRISIINNNSTLTQLSEKSANFEPMTVNFEEVFYTNLDSLVDKAVSTLHSAYNFIDDLEQEVFSIEGKEFAGKDTHSVGQVKQSYDKTGSVAQKAFGDQWK